MGDMRKLGKKAPRLDERTLRLERYLNLAQLPPAPPTIDWGSHIAQWDALGNDQYGDCTCAGAAHLVEAWTREASGVESVVTEAQTLAAYSAVTGFNPNDPSTDNGAAELDMLNFWRNTGIAGHKIGAYAAIRRMPGNSATWLAHLKASVFLLGGAYLGAEMPISAQSQDVWDVPPEGLHGDGTPGNWGGHAIPVIAYRPSPSGDLFTVVSWGERIDVTARWMAAYVDESYAIFSTDWLRSTHVAPSGFDGAALQADLALLGR